MTLILFVDTRDRKPNPKYTLVCIDHFSPSYKPFLATMHSLTEPQSYNLAIASPQWQLAIADELTTRQKGQT